MILYGGINKTVQRLHNWANRRQFSREALEYHRQILGNYIIKFPLYKGI